MEHRAIQFQLWETTFLPTGQPADPYRDGWIRVEITDPYGEIRWREGFWDGGLWRFRWMPLEEGPHHLRVETNLGGLPESLGVVVAPFATLAFGFQHSASRSGPIRISDDRTRFSRHDGDPLFVICDTVREIPTRATDAEWAYFVARRQAQRFTAVAFGTEEWSHARADRFRRYVYDPQTGDLDLGVLADLDRRIIALNAAGLVAIPKLFDKWMIFNEIYNLHPSEERDALSVENAIRIGRYLVARWGAYDVAWLLELAGGSREEADVVRDSGAVGRGIFGDDPWRAPVGLQLSEDTLHSELLNEPWLGWLAYEAPYGLETGRRWIHDELAPAAARRGPQRPYANLSIPNPDDLSRLRGWAYASAFTAAPSGIGVSLPDLWTPKAEVVQSSEGIPLDLGTGWDAGAEERSAAQLTSIPVKISKHHWNDLRPAPALLEAQPFPNDPLRQVQVLANSDGSMVRAFLPNGGAVRFPTLIGPVTAYWVDLRLGGSDLEIPEAEGRDTFQAPSDEDWILEIDAD